MSAPDSIRQRLRQIADDASLLEERSFVARSEAIDELEFVRARLEQVDAALFDRLRQEIRSGPLRGTALLECIRTFVPPLDSPDGRYDHLDTFMTGLLLRHPLPDESPSRENDMVFYQRTPSRVVLELIERAQMTPDDVFYDIGSGLGEVTVLTNLLTEATTKGVEYEPSYCEYARQLVRDLNLRRIEFLNADARNADFSDGTVFFLYTPFVGGMLQEVLHRLRTASSVRRTRIFTYGPCTSEVAQQDWLTPIGPDPLRTDQLAEFALVGV